MRKTLILTALSFGLLTATTQARIPNLDDFVRKNTKTSADTQPFQQAAALILWAKAGGNFLSLGKNYVIEFNESSREDFDTLINTVPAKGLAPMVRALKEETLHLDRDGINFTLSNNDGISTDFRIGTEEQLADAKTLTDSQLTDISIEEGNEEITSNPFRNVNDYQRARIYSELLSDNEMTDPNVINLALFEAHKLSETYKRYVYAAYLRRNTVKRSLRAIIFEESQNFTENEKVFIYKALIERVKPDSETAMTILTEARNFTKGNKATIYVAYIKRGKAEKERVEQMMKETETFDGMYRSWIYAAYIERKDTELDQANAIIERAKDFNKWQQKDIYKAYIARKDADPQIIEKNDMERIVR